MDRDLYLAARAGDDAQVASLLAAGADPTAVDAEDRTALECAAEAGHADVVKRLWPRMTGEYPEFYRRKALEAGHVDMVRWMLDQGTDFDDDDSDGMMRCPVCFKRNSPDFDGSCDHWLCNYGGEDFFWTTFYWEPGNHLQSNADTLEYSTGWSAKPFVMPEFRAWYERLADGYVRYWDQEPGIESIKWMTGGWLSDAGEVLAHPDGAAFRERIDASYHHFEDVLTRLATLLELADTAGISDREPDHAAATLNRPDLLPQRR